MHSTTLQKPLCRFQQELTRRPGRLLDQAPREAEVLPRPRHPPLPGNKHAVRYGEAGDRNTNMAFFHVDKLKWSNRIMIMMMIIVNLVLI